MFEHSHRRQLTAAGLMATCVVIGCGRLSPDVAPDSKNFLAIRQEIEKIGQTANTADVSTSVNPTGWATLKGTVRFDGPVPDRKTLAVDKEKEVCAPGGMQVLSEELIVGSDGAIKDVLIFLSQQVPSDEPWTHPEAKSAPAGSMLFDQKSCVFLSHVVAMHTGQTLVLKNSDPVGHNTAMKPKNNPASDVLIPGGGQSSYVAKNPEDQPFQVSCAIHPWMKSWVIFRPNSYFSVTNESGKFEIKNLPAGVPLEFRIWQEKGKLEKAVVDGTTQKWSKGKFKMTLTPNETKEVSLTFDASNFK